MSATPSDSVNAETERLREDAAREKNWKRWGPYLSERQWGTVREDYSADGNPWESFPARSRAQPRLSLGRGWLARDHGSRMPALLRARAVEWARSDFEGAPFRPDRPGGQPRRGREGMLLLPRLDADAFLHEGALQISAGGVSLRATWSRKTAGAAAAGRSSNCADTGVFDEGATSMSSPSTPRRAPNDILIRITVANRGPEPAHAAPAADAVVSQHVVVGRRAGDGEDEAVAAFAARASLIAAEHERLGRLSASPSKARPRPLFTENETNAQRLSDAPNPAPLRERCVPRICRSRQRRAR